MNPNERGRRGERDSALWGTGARGGESRSNALWGKGGRGALLTVVASLAMALPLAASATRDSSTKQGNGTTYIAPSLLQYEKSHGGDKVDVIIQSSGGVADATTAYNGLGLGNGLGALKKLDLVGGIAVTIPANKLDKLSQTDGLVVTPDSAVKSSGFNSTQLWPYASGNSVNWSSDSEDYSSTTPTIAIVDSGIDTTRVSDFGARVIGSVNLSTLPNNSPGDGRGHGTFVAAIAAGSASGRAGAAPTAKLLSVDVMDDTGTGSTSDIINACQWILDHKAQYNIRVANFSLHSGIVAPFYYDPLDQAVEKLWFGGVTVVAAAGNYGTGTTPSGVRYSPGNDPLVITVGAADIKGTITTSDDGVAPWSAWGYTMDGFSKPDLSAPGRYMVGAVPGQASLPIQRPQNVVAPGYMQLSGTSFAAPVVAGTAAQILARHPSFTPDQVKGALMVTARPFPSSVGRAGGVGEITASKAPYYSAPPNPNKALEQFYATNSTGARTFNRANWVSAVQSSASWDSASWDSASWLDASWDSASWLDASWDSASWLDASWDSASWLDASWLDASWEDAAMSDVSSTGGYTLDATQEAALNADPTLAPDPSVLPPTTP